MKIEELTLTISDNSGVEPQAVRKVLEATFSLLGERLSKEEKVELQGLGTFARKQARKSNKEGKTLFTSWTATGAKSKKRKAGKGRKKAGKKAGAEKGSSP
ncbi:MAG TPA: HU family DNA-binding protein [Rhizomicrobium sp.]|nr:HU family DNA-binding protein [Rhizomicrobium sp.]